MADETVSLELFIQADKSTLTLGELEKGFEALNEQIKEVPRNSKEFKALQTELAKTGREVKKKLK